MKQPRGWRGDRIMSSAGQGRANFLTVDTTARTITKGKGRGAQTEPVDGVEVSLDGGGSTASPGAVLAFGVAGLAARRSQLYLVIDGATFQWRIRVHNVESAHRFIANLTTWRRSSAAAAAG